MKKVRSQAEKRVDSFDVGTGLRRAGNTFSLRPAGKGTENNLGGVYTTNQGLTIDSDGFIYANYATFAKSDVYSAYGSIALGEGLKNVSETGDKFRRTAVDLGKGMEYEDIPIPEDVASNRLDANDGEVYLYRKKIRPLLGNGLEFSEKTLTDDDGGTTTVYAIQPKLGNGLEFAEKKEKDPVTEEEVVTYLIQPKLGEGLKFDGNGAVAVDGTGGAEYTAGTGIEISSDNQISLLPAGGSIGGVKAGEGVNIAADGTISVTGGGADISAGGGIEITTEDEKPKIAVKCGEGCEINDSGELVTVPNIEHAIFISEADAKYLLHEYTQIEYIAGNQIVYAGASNPVIVQGYVLTKYVYSGDNASNVLVYIKDDEDGSVYAEEMSRFTFFSRIELNNAYFNYKSCNITELRLTFVSWDESYTTYNLEYVKDDGTAVTLHEIETRNAAGAPSGITLFYRDIIAPNVTKKGYSSETGFVIAYYGYKIAPSTNGTYYYRRLTAQTEEICIPFASLAEYNAAVGLTYEPLSLTQINETTTVV